MSPPDGSPYLLVGNKGSGKSALMLFLKSLLASQKVPALVINPSDIDTSAIGDSYSTGDMRRLFRRSLLSAISGTLAANQKGYTDDQLLILNNAVDAGRASPSDFFRLASFLSEIAKPLIKTDLAAAFPKLLKSTQSDVEDAIARVVGRSGFHVFLDDTDQVANPDKAGHLNRVWALILAVRDLAQTTPNLRFVVSLRSEVWNRLRNDSAGQRDQTDHFNSLVVPMYTSEEHVGRILDRRMALAAATTSKGFLSSYDPFFSTTDARAPKSHERRLWKDLVVVRSRERPRDAIQLVHKMASLAIEEGKEKIDEAIFHEVMPQFSETVSGQVAQEVERECPQAGEIIREFAFADYDEIGFTLTADAAKSSFKRILSRTGVTLFGRLLRQDSEDDLFDLWRLFYAIGFLSARVSDSTQQNGFAYLSPAHEPRLISKSRWNDMQKVLWEVHPAYRDYLIAKQVQRQRETGLAFKKPHRRNKR